MRRSAQHLPCVRTNTRALARSSSMSEAGDDDDFAGGHDRTQHLRTQFAAAVAEVLDAKGNGGSASEALPRPTQAFAQQLTEVAWQWTTTALAPDLEAFQKHSKRSVIAADDVLLAARKNEATHALLCEEADRLRDSAAAKKNAK